MPGALWPLSKQNRVLTPVLRATSVWKTSASGTMRTCSAPTGFPKLSGAQHLDRGHFHTSTLCPEKAEELRMLSGAVNILQGKGDLSWPPPPQRGQGLYRGALASLLSPCGTFPDPSLTHLRSNRASITPDLPIQSCSCS